jgi:hypothetical protein
MQGMSRSHCLSSGAYGINFGTSLLSTVSVEDSIRSVTHDRFSDADGRLVAAGTGAKQPHGLLLARRASPRTAHPALPELRPLRALPASHLDRCQSMELLPERVSGQAQLYGYTWATQAFHPYFVDKLPYCSAVVELAEDAGVRMTTNIIDCPRDEVRTGMRVEVLFREVAPGLVLPLFRPDVSHVGSR